MIVPLKLPLPLYLRVAFFTRGTGDNREAA